MIAESAIDALSYHQLHRKENERTRYVSLAGTPSPSQLDLVDKLVGTMPTGSTVIAAVDGDVAGTKIAKQLENIAEPSPRGDLQARIARASTGQGLERRASARGTRLHPHASCLRTRAEQGRTGAVAMRTLVQLRSRAPDAPTCELVYGEPEHLAIGITGTVAVFSGGQVVAYFIQGSAARRLFVFRSLEAEEKGAARLPGVRPRVRLLDRGPVARAHSTSSSDSSRIY